GGDGYDGAAVWTVDATGRSWVLGDQRSVDRARVEAACVQRVYWQRDRAAVSVQGAGRKIDGKVAFDVLQVAPRQTTSFELWIDPATHLPSRVVEPSDQDVLVTAFSDYRTAGAVKLPFE